MLVCKLVCPVCLSVCRRALIELVQCLSSVTKPLLRSGSLPPCSGTGYSVSTPYWQLNPISAPRIVHRPTVGGRQLRWQNRSQLPEPLKLTTTTTTTISLLRCIGVQERQTYEWKHEVQRKSYGIYRDSGQKRAVTVSLLDHTSWRWDELPKHGSGGTLFERLKSLDVYRVSH